MMHVVCMQTESTYTLSNFKIRRDVTRGRFLASVLVTLKRTCFAAIPYSTHAFYGNSSQIHNDITSNLEAGQSIDTYRYLVDKL